VVAPATVYTFPELVTDNRPECTQAADWVNSNATNLPSNIRDLTAFPEVYQRAIFAKLPSDRRAALWRSRLDEALADGRLSTEERAMVRKIRDRISESLFESPEVLTNLKDTFEVALIGTNKATQEVLAPYFFTLGDDRDGRLTVRSSRVLIARMLQQAASVLAAPECECNSGYELCQPFYQPPTFPIEYCCCGMTYVCANTFSGCGWLWMEPCDGKCVSSPCAY
jgi:hypothetical protein